MLYVDGCALNDVDDFFRQRPTVGIVRGDIDPPFRRYSSTVQLVGT